MNVAYSAVGSLDVPEYPIGSAAKMLVFLASLSILIKNYDPVKEASLKMKQIN